MRQKMKRSSGILMPIFSLPSPYGIGTMGKEAYRFIDFLHSSGQSWWQLLPLGPTSYGDSPYSSLSAFAGNPYFIDLDFLCDDSLLNKDELSNYNWGNDKSRVDYGAIYSSRFIVLRKAYLKGKDRYKEELAQFEKENEDWLNDYALFMALKSHFNMKAFTSWDDEKAITRDEKRLSEYREKLSDDISFYSFLQFLFFKQWNNLKKYAESKGIGIIGDIPIYCAMDSADVWASPSSFQLDDRCIAKEVSGVPPDYFNKDGQLWGNPLYNWDGMKENNYKWWINRIKGASRLYDVIRFDHFRGLESYYAVPSSEKTAKKGRWLKGPGKAFTSTLNASFPSIQFAAEDLGYLTEDVIDLLSSSTWPGMKVLQFAFDTREKGDYDPLNYKENSLCYTGTHDNNTLKGWIEEVDKTYLQNAIDRFETTDENKLVDSIIEMGMMSNSFMMITPLQDFLKLGKEARINIPGTKSGNWVWRLESLSLLEKEEKRIKDLTTKANRI